jgi:uncharacterized caspase-like protein
MTVPGAVAGFDRSLAFLVAIDRYTNGVPKLRTPVADAWAFAELLRKHHGFETEIVSDEAATGDRLRRFFGGLRERVGRDDRVLFYFAGHGIALPSGDGPRGYVLPQDADRTSEDSYLPMVELQEALSALPCRHMLVILDCCFAGALRWASYRHLSVVSEALHQERYAWYVRDPAWQAIASAAHNEKALDVVAGESLGARRRGAAATPHSPRR